MKLRVLPYVTVEIDDRVRRRLRIAGERVRGMCDRAVNRVDSVVASVNDKLGPTDPAPGSRLRVVGREAS